MKYDGLLLTLSKRMSERYQAQASFVLSKAYGLLPSSGFGPATSQTTQVYQSSLGWDANDFANAMGKLQNDRTHTFRFTGTVFAPWGILVGVNYGKFSGKPWAGGDLVGRSLLPQATVGSTSRLPAGVGWTARASWTCASRGRSCWRKTAPGSVRSKSWSKS